MERVRVRGRAGGAPVAMEGPCEKATQEQRSERWERVVQRARRPAAADLLHVRWQDKARFGLPCQLPEHSRRASGLTKGLGGQGQRGLSPGHCPQECGCVSMCVKPQEAVL